MARTTKPDTQLIRDVLAGKREAFAPLVARYREGVYALVWSRVGDFALAEDITQETFITAYSRLSKLRDPSRFPAWLRRIAVNTARMWLRGQAGREASIDLDGAVEPDKRECGLREEITRILAALPDEKRKAAILCYLDGVSRKDAARFLGVPEGTLRKRLHDAKRLLQRGIVEEAERSLEEHLLPRDFASRCLCACERAVDAKRKGVESMDAKKKKCDCGCLPQSEGKDKKRDGKKSKAGTKAKAPK